MKENRTLKNTGVYKTLKDVHLYDKWGQKLTETVDSLKDGLLGNSPDGVASMGYSKFLSTSPEDCREYGLEVMTDYIANSLKRGKDKEQAAYEATMLGSTINAKRPKGDMEYVKHCVENTMKLFDANDKVHGIKQGRNVLRNIKNLLSNYE